MRNPGMARVSRRAQAPAPRVAAQGLPSEVLLWGLKVGRPVWCFHHRAQTEFAERAKSLD